VEKALRAFFLSAHVTGNLDAYGERCYAVAAFTHEAAAMLTPLLRKRRHDFENA